MDNKQNGLAADKGGEAEETELGFALNLKIPEEHLSTLVDVTAMAQSEVCDGTAVSNSGLGESVAELAQIVFRQAYQLGGPDEVWKNPQDGSYHHPTFAEGAGEAWEAAQEARLERFHVDLIEVMTDVLVEKSKRAGKALGLERDYYEHLCQDLIEAHGPKGMIMALMT